MIWVSAQIIQYGRHAATVHDEPAIPGVFSFLSGIPQRSSRRYLPSRLWTVNARRECVDALDRADLNHEPQTRMGETPVGTGFAMMSSPQRGHGGA